jgi:ubiquinone/menaquinone biosynthesis C-methylase UbiE
VLEHVRRPWIAINEMHRILQPDGYILITTLFSFHIHGYPDDYWRFTPHCMWHLLNDAGFVDILIETDGNYHMILDDHGSGKQVVQMFNHIFASARKP